MLINRIVLSLITFLIFFGCQKNDNATDSTFPLTIKDASGNIYPTIKIGTQTWMAENLRTTKYSDGSDIPVVSDNAEWANNEINRTTLPMMCWYNNDQITYTSNKIGALYNWYAITPSTNGNKNVCPTGWHVPSDEEWSILINYLDPLADGGNNDNVAGGKMKSTGTDYWLSPNTNATNTSGFSGLPGSRRDYLGGFYNIGAYGYWWSSSVRNNINPWYRVMTYNFSDIGRGYYTIKADALSVRCIKD
jgi:uncharacterized protein (TIGR02145 family)